MKEINLGEGTKLALHNLSFELMDMANTLHILSLSDKITEEEIEKTIDELQETMIGMKCRGVGYLNNLIEIYC